MSYLFISEYLILVFLSFSGVSITPRNSYLSMLQEYSNVVTFYLTKFNLVNNEKLISGYN